MQKKKVLVIGGAGYVGSVLVPKLLALDYEVDVFDTFWFGWTLPHHDKLLVHPFDMRKKNYLKEAVQNADVVVHLACISNDPSFDLDPKLGKSINLDAFLSLVNVVRESKQKNGNPNLFVYASSSSVYGIKEEENVTEDLELEPLTDYSKYKVLCELALKYSLPASLVPWVVIRPATVCGWSPRLRLDLAVNILTAHAYFNRKIKVFGGAQKRPNLHIDDMTDLYVELIQKSDARVFGECFNAGWENFTLMEIAHMVKSVVGSDVEIEVVPTNDNRSYHVSSAKIKRLFGWEPQKTIKDAVRDMVKAFEKGLVVDMNNPAYHNIKTMQKLNVF
ncbi:MAG: SDR family oxidoreductase [Candidatus Marinimicrobia bacterium]|nr:SDR family oxidoreductase [Candidatus Neomarinimicrobiota bacterium]